MSDIDKALVDHGIQRNAEKNLTGATNGTALGIDLVDGMYFAFAFKKLGILPSWVTFILNRPWLGLVCGTDASQVLALELQLQPFSVLVERGTFRVCLIGVSWSCAALA